MGVSSILHIFLSRKLYLEENSYGGNFRSKTCFSFLFWKHYRKKSFFNILSSTLVAQNNLEQDIQTNFTTKIFQWWGKDNLVIIVCSAVFLETILIKSNCFFICLEFYF